MRGCNIKEFHCGVALANTGVNPKMFKTICLVPFEISTEKSKLENGSSNNATNFLKILLINFFLGDLKKKL